MQRNSVTKNSVIINKPIYCVKFKNDLGIETIIGEYSEKNPYRLFYRTSNRIIEEQKACKNNVHFKDG